jgi:hypothetical protein
MVLIPASQGSEHAHGVAAARAVPVTLGDEFMNTTKTKLRRRITVPSEVMEVLRWPVATQLTTPTRRRPGCSSPPRTGAFARCLSSRRRSRRWGNFSPSVTSPNGYAVTLALSIRRRSRAA